MPIARRRSWCALVLTVFTVLGAASAKTLSSQQGPVAAPPERVDYLTFAQGAIPVGVGGAGARLGASFEEAIEATDGNPRGFVLTGKAGAPDTDTELVYQLPALTTFDRFAVPNVLETPSPSQTFTRRVEVYGSIAGPEKGMVLLGEGNLSTHKARGQVTELAVRSKTPVRWVKLRLVGGIEVAAQAFFEFSEIIGNGTQEVPRPVDHFTGTWKGRGVLIKLKQEGAVVFGCYDLGGKLEGTVTGNILRAVGVDGSSGVGSAFLLSVAEDGSLRGVRSTNQAPFVLYAGDAAPKGTEVKCPEPAAPALGCGSIIHGINFDFDSAVIRPGSEPVLASLHQGLSGDRSAAIVIEGHTSSEGTNEYNQRLSERRAQAVVDELVKRGIDAKRLKAAGLGETRPIAGNDDEAGRSLNRRVEIKCR